MVFIVGDQWQGLGLGTKMVDYVLEIAKEMGVENVYAIMLPANYRALNLTKEMGFNLEYLADGTVKGILDLKEEILKIECPPPKATQEAPKTALQKEVLAKCEEMSPEESEATPA